MQRSPSPTRSVVSAELRQLWEAGQRRGAIRTALEHWQELLRQPDDLRWLEEALRTSGLRAEAFALRARATCRPGASAQAWESLVRSVLQSGDPWWARELLEVAGSGTAELQALRIEVELALGNLGDASALIPGWVRDHRDEAAREAAVMWWVRAGRVDEAERLLESVEGLPLWRARLALWRSQPARVRALLDGVPPCPERCCLEAVAALLEGRLAEAEVRLRELLDSEVRADAWTWLTTVLRKQRRYSEAMQAADAASSASPTFNLVVRLERELAGEQERLAAYCRKIVSKVLASVGLTRITKRTVGEMEHAEVLCPLLGLSPGDAIVALEGLLERFGGNHTPNVTTTDGVRLISHRLPSDPRYLGANIQLVLWTRGADTVRDIYRELASPVKSHPLFRIYHGEAELWMGAYERAERIFRDILGKNPKVLWAWIGLGASVMLQGELREAQKIWEKGLSLTHSAGPTLYVYRGECYRRQGDLARARGDLEVALRQKPHRLSARINFALLQEKPGAVEEIVRECEARAPLLMEELSGTPAERLEKVLESMRGNRSSSIVSYHLWGHVWRMSTPGPSAPSS